MFVLQKTHNCRENKCENCSQRTEHCASRKHAVLVAKRWIGFTNKQKVVFGGRLTLTILTTLPNERNV